MPSRLTQLAGAVSVRRLLLYGSITTSIVTLLLVALLLALPSIVSTQYGQNLVRQSLKKSLQREVTWSAFRLSWSDGLALRNLVLGPGKPSLLGARVGTADLVPRLGYRDGRFRFDLKVQVRGVAAELVPGPPKPPAPYKEPLTAVAEALQRMQALDWPLPLEVSAQVAVDPVHLSYRDPQSGRTVEVRQGFLRLDAPSLAQSPVTSQLRGDLVVDGHPIQALTLSADLRHLVNASRHIRPASALVALDAGFPGTSVTLRGGLMEPFGLAAQARVDLPRLMAVAKPFLPPDLPSPSGSVALDLKGRIDAPNHLQMDLALTGTRIALSGGRLGRRSIAPLDLRLAQRVASDLKRQQVQFTGGTLAVDNWLAAAWQAEVERPSSRDRDLSARLGPVKIDLGRLVAVAEPFLPPQFPVRELRGELALRQGTVELKGRKNRGEAALTGLSLTAPRLQLALATGGLSAQGIQVGVDQATLPLAQLQPTGAVGSLSYAVARLDLSGGTPIHAEGVRGGLRLTLEHLDLKSRSPRKVTADGQLNQLLEVQRLDVKGQLAAETLREELATRVQAKENGEIEIPSPTFNVSAGSLRTLGPGDKMTANPLVATLTAGRILLPSQKGAPPLLERVAGTLNGEIGVTRQKPASPQAAQAVDIERLLRRIPLSATLATSGIRLPGQKGAPLAIERAEFGVRADLDLKTGKQPAPPAPAAATGKGGDAGKAAPAAKAAAAGPVPTGGAFPGRVPLTATISASGIVVPGRPGAAPTVERAVYSVSGGDFLKLDGTAALSGAAPPKVSSDGTLRIDLDRALPLVRAALPSGAAAGGVTSLAWKVVLPSRQGAPAPATKNPLAAAKAMLARLERGDVTLTLANHGISYPLSSGKVTVAELRTPQPVHLQLAGPGGSVKLEGGISFAGLSGLPGAAGGFPAQSGTLSLAAQLTNWQSLRLHEELKIQQFELTQRADAAVSRIDVLMEKQSSLSAASLLQTLDAAVTGDLKARFPATPTAIPGGAKVSGDLNTGVRVNLAAGRELQVNAAANARDFGLRLATGTSLEGLRGEFLVDRSYALARRSADGWTPLSTSLVRPAPVPFASGGAAEIINRVREDLQGQEHGSRRFTVKKLVVTGGKAPLELRALEGDLLFTPETVGLSFFQADTLGGTVRLRGVIDLKPEIPALAADCSFTNLETLQLASTEARKLSARQRQETEITGELTLAAPLATRERELLEGVRMRLNLRKIGADTLERALFSLDPYEKNEQLVAQRKMLRMGTLKSLRAGTLDGAFSIEGEVRVKGVDLALPKVERIRLAEIAQQKQLAGAVAAVISARKFLDLARADTLVVGSKGEISLVRRGHEK